MALPVTIGLQVTMVLPVTTHTVIRVPPKIVLKLV